MRILTPDEIEKLPHCKHDRFQRCSEESKVDLKKCLSCCIDTILTSLHQDDKSWATHITDVLTKILEENKMLPELPETLVKR